MAAPGATGRTSPAPAGGKTADSVAPEALNSRQQAAILIMAMGAEVAKEVLGKLADDEVVELTEAITQVSYVPEEVRKQVLRDVMLRLRQGYSAGGPEAARHFLQEALGPEKAAAILKSAGVAQAKSEYFDFLNRVEAGRVVALLQDEQAQTMALILSYLNPAQAAEVFLNLPAETQVDVAERIGTMGKISPAMLRRLEATLQRQVEENTTQRAAKPVGGVKAVAGLLNQARSVEVEKRVYEGLTARNQKLAEEIRSLMLTFEDLNKIPDASMQAILREVDLAVMALALKGASQQMKDLIFRSLSQRAGERLKEHIDLLGPKPRGEVQAARDQVVAVARQLEEEGKITLGRGGGGDEIIE